MKEYIEREAALDIVTEWCPDDDGSVGKTGDLRGMLDELEAIPAADVVEEENILKFYYVRSIDEYWIGQRIDNFYYAEYDPKSRQWVWTHSRYLPWGEHIVSPTSLWKEHTYPSEPEEIPFAEWLQGFIKKHAADVAEVRHGRWLSKEYMYGDAGLGDAWFDRLAEPSDYFANCSVCGKDAEHNAEGSLILSDYCPNCGARMDGGVNDGRT